MKDAKNFLSDTAGLRRYFSKIWKKKPYQFSMYKKEII